MTKDLLALKIINGDEQAFELLFRNYYLRLCSFCNKFIQDNEEAREIAEEVFLKIWENRKDIDPEESLCSYMFKIARNMSINRLRRKKVESRYIDILKTTYIDHDECSGYESFISRELEKNIQAAIDKIPPKCKKVFELSRIEGLRYLQIAELLNISIKTVEVHMSKALNILRVELKEYL